MESEEGRQSRLTAKIVLLTLTVCCMPKACNCSIALATTHPSKSLDYSLSIGANDAIRPKVLGEGVKHRHPQDELQDESRDQLMPNAQTRPILISFHLKPHNLTTSHAMPPTPPSHGRTHEKAHVPDVPTGKIPNHAPKAELDYKTGAIQFHTTPGHDHDGLHSHDVGHDAGHDDPGNLDDDVDYMGHIFAAIRDPYGPYKANATGDSTPPLIFTSTFNSKVSHWRGIKHPPSYFHAWGYSDTGASSWYRYRHASNGDFGPGFHGYGLPGSCNWSREYATILKSFEFFCIKAGVLMTLLLSINVSFFAHEEAGQTPAERQHEDEDHNHHGHSRAEPFSGSSEARRQKSDSKISHAHLKKRTQPTSSLQDSTHTNSYSDPQSNDTKTAPVHPEHSTHHPHIHTHQAPPSDSKLHAHSKPHSNLPAYRNSNPKQFASRPSTVQSMNLPRMPNINNVPSNTVGDGDLKEFLDTLLIAADKKSAHAKILDNKLELVQQDDPHTHLQPPHLPRHRVAFLGAFSSPSFAVTPNGVTPVEGLRLMREMREFQRVFGPQAILLPAASFSDLEVALQTYDPSIIHLSGHCHEDSWIFEGKNRAVSSVTGAEIGRLIRISNARNNANANTNYGVHCVVLSGCKSAAVAESIKKQCPSVLVLAADTKLNNTFATDFCSRFYHKLNHYDKKTLKLGIHAGFNTPSVSRRQDLITQVFGDTRREFKEPHRTDGMQFGDPSDAMHRIGPDGKEVLDFDHDGNPHPPAYSSKCLLCNPNMGGVFKIL
mmetsp:Transcript_2845/g.4315  ORF Transcript_2845/g.4315 Transcript_2845/m.4315 type:complete len:772 (-) Transcript_2845:192-2507(-)